MFIASTPDVPGFRPNRDIGSEMITVINIAVKNSLKSTTYGHWLWGLGVGGSESPKQASGII
jgi:hypothetical protein